MAGDGAGIGDVGDEVTKAHAKRIVDRTSQYVEEWTSHQGFGGRVAEEFVGNGDCVFDCIVDLCQGCGFCHDDEQSYN